MLKLIGPLLLLLAACTPSPKVGYIDPTKALNDTGEGKANIASLNAYSSAKRSELALARAEVKKAQDAKKDEAEVATLKAKADEIERTGQAELERRQREGADKISKGLERILPKLRAAHGFDALMVKPLDVDPALDLTAELTSRYNSGEGDAPPPAPPMTVEVEALRKEVAELKAAKTGSAPVAINNQKKTGGTP
jgi:HAMP domain-containing protein